MKNLWMAVRLTVLACLAGCGGGGGESDGPCGGSDLRVSITYEVNGQLVDATRPIILSQGMSVVAVPRFIGLPAACGGAARLTVSKVLSSSVPTGLTLDNTTGVLSGTTMARGSIGFWLTLKVDGYLSAIEQDVVFFM